jgi:hypothetical protein
MMVAPDPEDPTGERRILASTKSNLSKKPASLAYRFNVNGEVATLAWEGASPHTARSLLAQAKDGEPPEDRNAAKDAVNFLNGELGQRGPRLYQELLAEAKKAGISEITLRRAKAQLGIQSQKRGFGETGEWYWGFPASDPEPSSDPAPNPGLKDDHDPTPKMIKNDLFPVNDHLKAEAFRNGLQSNAPPKMIISEEKAENDHLSEADDRLQEPEQAPEPEGPEEPAPSLTLDGTLPRPPRRRRASRPKPAWAPDPQDPRPVLLDTQDPVPAKIPPGVPIGVDTEARGGAKNRPPLPWYPGDTLVCAGFAVSLNGSRSRFAFPAEDRVQIQRWLASPNPKVFHNAIYDLVWLRSAGFTIDGPVHDSRWLIMFENGLAITDLKQAGPYQFAVHYPNETNDLALILSYCGNDSLDALGLFSHPSPWRAQLLYQLYSRMVSRIAEMCLRGIPIFKDRLEQAYQAVTTDQADTLRVLGQYASINWQSPDQVREVFRKTLPGKTTPTGKPSVDLEAMAECTHPAALYRTFTRAGMLFRTFLRPIRPLDRLRGLFSLGGAWTGRMSCRYRNLQNVPKDPAHRSIYGDSRHLWIKWDFQTADLVVIASLTNCQGMLDVFARGGDLHKHTAAMLLDRPITSITDAERDVGKTLNFGCCYGGGVPMILARAREFGVEMTPEAARAYQIKFFNSYPEVLAWQRETARKLRAGIPIESAFGRRWIRSTNQRGVWNQLLAAPISGTTTDLLLTGLDAAWSLLEQCGVELVNLVHDEADFLARADAWPDIAKTIEAAAWTMAEVDRRFPMRVEVAIGPDWGSTKKQFVVGGAR